VIDYATEDFADGTRHYDLIIDVFGRTPIHRLRRALTPTGRLVIAGGEGDRWVGGIHRQLWASVLSPFVRQKLGAFVVREHARTLGELNPLIEDQKVTPLLDRTFPMSEAANAVRYMEHGQARGRIALKV
jgi:NADPH:quinone reductase-like Zn-dependent oxidoreductase